MRRTAKYLAGIALARALGGKVRDGSTSHEALYDTLESRGYWWDASAQKWTDAPKPSSSVFAQDGGGDIPSGVVMLRVMAHPDQIETAATEVVDALGEDWALIQQSGQYPNRKGIGVRIYLTFKKG
jgi:hypothetical protein